MLFFFTFRFFPNEMFIYIVDYSRNILNSVSIKNVKAHLLGKEILNLIYAYLLETRHIISQSICYVFKI